MPPFIAIRPPRNVSCTLSPSASARLRNRARFVDHKPADIIRALVRLYLEHPEYLERSADTDGRPVFHTQRELVETYDPDQTSFGF